MVFMDPQGMNDCLKPDHVNMLFKLKHEDNEQHNALCVIDVLCLHSFILTAKCF